jgi:crossover junction endodeoxyribonuclease RusA
MADVVVSEADEIMVGLKFFPPDARKRDLDNMLSSCKSALDGMADALEVNDQRFAFVLRRCDPVKGGRVVVALS